MRNSKTQQKTVSTKSVPIFFFSKVTISLLNKQNKCLLKKKIYKIPVHLVRVQKSVRSGIHFFRSMLELFYCLCQLL